MAATREQLEQLLGQMSETPPDVPFRQVVVPGGVGYIPLDALEIAQRKIDEEKYEAAKMIPKPPTLAQKLAELEARLKVLEG